MKKILGTMVALAILAICSRAEAVIKIEAATVQNGLAYISGKGAVTGSPITWDGSAVTTANNKNGGFSFNGALPDDCIGALSDTASTINVQVLGCTPVPKVVLLKTGQTTSYAAGDDGYFQAGIPVPSPRFTDNGDGTVTDNLTKLIWLKNATCLLYLDWASAIAVANTLADGNIACSLTDGSVAGDWRLPNRNELTSLLDLGTYNLALPAGNPFVNFAAYDWWSSTTMALQTIPRAWVVNFLHGEVKIGNKTNSAFVTAVRGGL